MKLDLSGLSERERAEFDARMEVLKTRAHPGVRIAMVCPAGECNHRAFGDLEWKCPEHGRSVRQVNRPYLGVSTV